MTIDKATFDLLRHLAGRPGHDEVKADFRQLLIEEFGAELSELDFELRVPEVHGRLDALIGRTVFEAKKNLEREWGDVERRMPDYLADRESETGEKFVGIASDGLKWVVFERQGDTLVKVKETTLDPEKGEQFLAWLDGALALKTSLPPDPLTVRAELGQESVAYRLARDMLAALWEKVKSEPAVALKRQLWAQLLKLVYGKDVENDQLFFQHTFLVVVAKAIALAVLDLREDDPKRVLSGAAFEAAGVNGAAESDFFDWVVAHPDGEALVRRILAHVRRFRLDQVESDVLKILYESLIDRDERHGLGEYYTPDWLAAKIVRHAVERPMEQRVLDPACGSGTFLFHAVRNALTAAEDAGVPLERRAAEVTALVNGLDIHPVAVIIARVTYLLALQPVLINRRGAISIPVYLGDAMQLSVTAVLDAQELRVKVPAAPNGNGEITLDFPEVFCRDSMLFDKAIEVIRNASEAGWTRRQVEAQLGQTMHEHFIRTAGLMKPKEIGPLEEKGIAELGATYLTYDKLRRDGRNSIWSYVARNLSRPLAYTHAGSPWANVVVGNPPWVAYRHMSADLQKRFREIARAEQVLVPRVPSQNDLCALFAVRCAGFYLRAGGQIAFVLPLAALTRNQYEKFRLGSFTSATIKWEEVWTMDESVWPLFPVPSCVVFGSRRSRSAPIPKKVRAYSGKLPLRDAPESVADEFLQVEENVSALETAKHKGGSAYRQRFRNGATLFPRMLCFVERRTSGRLGSDAAAPSIVSRRSSQEKAPWKQLPSLEGRVESEFLRPVLLGESVLPFRVWRSFEAVVPITSHGEMLDAAAAAGRGLRGLNDWMRRAQELWDRHKRSSMSLKEMFDYFGQLSAQIPVKQLRVAYAASGTIPAAAALLDSPAVVEHGLYNAAVSSEAEARYLCAILNSETARKRVESMQARGQWGARHFDKVMFNLPIPRFDEKQKLHRDLAAAAAEAEKIAAGVALPENVKFQRARKLIRDALAEAGISQRIDKFVAQLLDKASP